MPESVITAARFMVRHLDHSTPTAAFRLARRHGCHVVDCPCGAGMVYGVYARPPVKSTKTSRARRRGA